MRDDCRITAGTRVVIREWDDMAEEFGVVGRDDDAHIPCYCNFISRMKSLCGKQGTVKQVFSDGIIRFSDLYTEGFTISTDMVRAVDDKLEGRFECAFDDDVIMSLIVGPDNPHP